MNNLLSLRRLFRVTGLLIIGIVFGVVLRGNLVKISLASVIPGIGDYGLGISVSNDKALGMLGASKCPIKAGVSPTCSASSCAWA